MALFMVLFSISSVNISKIQALQKSLKAAFSPDNILPGGKDIAQQGSTPARTPRTATKEICRRSCPLTPLRPRATTETSASAAQAAATVTKAQQEQSSFEHLKHEIDHTPPTTASPKTSTPRSSRAAW